MKKICKKIISCFILMIILFNNFLGIVSNATEINSADLVKIGSADEHLKYYREDTNSYRYVVCTIVGFYKDNNFYPAYCMNKDKIGVTEDYTYTVNVNEIINRDDVWRAVINGYPYKSAAEMGLANEFDAYAVTKFAVYCLLGESSIDKFYADSNDSEAVAMLNALRNLVDIGINGNQTRDNGAIEISKVGEFFENGDYYTQKYNINSNIEMNDYEIEGIENFPSDTIINKINSNEFELNILKSNLCNSIYGNIKIKGNCKTYPVFYGETSIEGTQNYVLTYNSFGDIYSTVSTGFETNTGKIKIIKLDEENSKEISDVKFGLYKDGSLIAEGITNGNGELEFENLYQGIYELKELESNENYYIKTESINVEVFYNNTTELKVTNKHKKGNLKIVKCDYDDKGITLGGIEFKLYTESGEFVGKYTTDLNGELFIENLNIGNYILEEVKAKNGYSIIDNISFSIEADSTKELEITNEKIKGRIKIIKVDKDNNEIKLKGVKFGIYNSNNDLVEEIITDKNGVAQTKHLPINGGEYIVKELETLKEYALSQDEIRIELQENEIKTIQFENELKKGNFQILKVDKDTKLPINGVVFELYNSKNKLLKTLTTDEDGKIFVDGLVEGKYYLKEKKTGKEYELLKDKIKFDIKYNETTNLEIENEKIKGRLKVIKVDEEDENIKLEGVKFEIYDEQSNILEVITTDKNGVAYSSFLPSVDRIYTLHEISTLENYILNDEYTFFKVNKNKDFIITKKNKKKPVDKKEEVEERIEEAPKVLPRTGY